MTAVLSNYGGNAALSLLLRAAGLYLAAHTANPTATGDPATEVAGGGYARQPIKFSAPSGKASANTNKAYFSGMPACVVWGLAVWDSPGAGNMIAALELLSGSAPAHITVDENGQLRVEVGDVAFAL